MPIYMGVFDKPNILSRSIRGEVTAQGYEGWIELQSAQIGTPRTVKSGGSGGGTGRTPPLSEIVVTKLQDSASTALFRESINGEPKLVVLAFVKDGNVYMTIILRGTLISGFSTSGGGGDSHARPMESLTLNFAQIAYNAHDRSPDAVGAPVQEGWGRPDASYLGP